MSVTTDPTVTAVATTGPRSRTTLLAAVLALAALTVVAMVLTRPGERNDFGYSALAAQRDALWLFGLLDGLALAVLAVTVGLAVCHLVRGRGQVWATVGAVVTTLGGICFAMGLFALATFAWYATATEAIPIAAGTDLVHYATEGQPARMILAQVTGFLLYTLGSLILAVAVVRSRTLPRWAPAGFIVLTLAQFAPLPAAALDVLQAVVTASLTGLAWVLTRPGPGSRWTAPGSPRPSRQA